MVFEVFLSIYIGSVLGIALATVFLILFGGSWGTLPRLYLRAIDFLQSFFPTNPNPAGSSTLIERSKTSALESHHTDSFLSFNFSISKENVNTSIFETCSNAYKAGFEAIVQDEMSSIFEPSPTLRTTLLKLPHLSEFSNLNKFFFLYLSGYAFSTVFRYFILLPIRLILLISSFLYVLVLVIMSISIDFSNRQRIKMSVIYSRLFCASLGSVINYHDLNNRPKRPGLAVSNHMTPNDVQIIYANVDPNDGDGYTITGQRHNGMIGVIETLVEKICPSVWLNRSNENDRKRFTVDVFNEVVKLHPVLLFPEGYCTNNTKVLRFRRAMFKDNINIYPIALKQNPQYGVSFWYEDDFWRYMFRVLTSWAIVYDVYYLESTRKCFDETNEGFARRVQDAIAEKIQAKSISLDGRLWYSKNERQRLKEIQRRNLAKLFEERYSEPTNDGMFSELTTISKSKTIEMRKTFTNEEMESALLLKTLPSQMEINFQKYSNSIPVST